jgi:hypothetical protein
MTIHDTFAIKASDGSVTYTTYDDLPDDVYEWEYWARDSKRSYFRFRLVPIGNIYRIYILAQPPYQGRLTDLIATHRHHDEIGYYICISSGNEPEKVPEAMSWYSYWAEQTVNYIATGRAFA